MTSSPRTLGLIVTLLAIGALSVWAAWQLGIETKATPVAKVQPESSAPSLANADLRGPASLSSASDALELESPTFERTSIDAASVPLGLRGVVVDMAGVPIASAAVSVLKRPMLDGSLGAMGEISMTSRERMSIVQSSSLTDELGRFEFSPALPSASGVVELTVAKKGYLPIDSFAVEDPRQAITIQLSRGASITLPVTAWPAIEADKNAAVRIGYLKAPDQYTNRVFESFPLDTFRGEVEQSFVGLTAETYVVEVVVGPGRWVVFSQTVTVELGEHRQLEPVEIGRGLMAYHLLIVDQYQRPVRTESMRVDYVNTGLTAFGIPATDAEGVTYFVAPQDLGPLRIKSYNNGAANLSPSFGTRVTKDGETKRLTFTLSL